MPGITYCQRRISNFHPSPHKSCHLGHMAQSRFYRFIADSEMTCLIQDLYCLKNRCCVLDLKITSKRTNELAKAMSWIMNPISFLFGLDNFIFRIGKNNRSRHKPCFTQKTVFYAALRLTDHHRNVRLYYPCFFGSDFFNRVAQQRCVVKRNIGYNGYFRSYDIGRIQSAAQSHFYYGNINTHSAEIIESHHRCQFKKRRGNRVFHHPEPFNKRDYFLFRNHLPVNTYSLPEIKNMWWCKKACLISGGR